jgi:alkaline phosphatase
MGINKKVLGITIACALLLGSIGIKTQRNQVSADKHSHKVKNVIMMVMDGTSVGATTLARWYKGENLALDEMVTGAVRTHSAESAITDSAPAATALATGHKSNDKFIGVLPSEVTTPGVEQVSEENRFKPVANVLEGAKLKGKATGIIATAEIQHATPAGFSAHANHRNDFETIAEQQVYQEMDVVLGGGKNSLLPDKRKDKEDLQSVLEEKGYELIETREELLNSKADKIWGAFASGALAYDMDRPYTNPEQPTLAEMTKKAINVLSKDKDGFFLFVEGSKPDWAAHANDTMGIISDVLAFDAAVKEALEFAKKDGHTLVIAVSDHGNSGITIGNWNTSKSYPSKPVSDYIDPLKKAKMTLEGAMSQLKDDFSNIEEVAKLYGIDNLTEAELNELTALKDKNAIGQKLAKLLADRANIGYSTGGHTGEDVFLYAYGPGKPVGLVDNTEIAHVMAKAMGFELEAIDKKLFLDAEKAFKKIGAKTRVDVTDPENPVLLITRGSKTAELPVNKNIMKVNGKEYKLNGVIVRSNHKFYIPQQAITVFQKAK